MSSERLGVSLSLSTLRRHDAICVEFEHAWQSDVRPRLEDYLARETEGQEALYHELLLIELDYRRRKGETPTIEDYSGRMPEHRDLTTQLIEEAVYSNEAETRFRIVREVAQGGLGQVFVAYDRQLRREVAVKELRDDRADDTELRRRFVRECQVTGRLEHPGIVPIYDFGVRPDGRPFYAMRFVRGQNLQTAYETAHRGGGLTAKARRRLVRKLIDVARAVEYAHRHGVLHRDLKPRNVMLGPHDEALLVDWGLAKIIDEEEDASARPPSPAEPVVHTAAGVVMGTPGFMSPEQATGNIEQVDVRSDIYGLGATLYAVLNGRSPPNSASTTEDATSEASSGKVVARVPRPLEAVCRKAMASEPADRYESAEAFADDLQRWLDDEPVSIYRDPLSVRVARWARRHRSIAAGAVVLVLATTAALAIGTVVLGEANRRLAASREVAQANIKLARGTVDDLLTDVSEETLLQTPGMQPLRNKLLNRALAYYQRFLEQDDDNATVRMGLAASYRRAGKISSDLGERKKAVVLMSKAVEIQRGLIAEFPEEAKYQAALALTYDGLAQAQLLSSDFSGARSSLQGALELRERLLGMEPHSVAHRNEMATTIGQIAYIEWSKADLAGALKTYRRAAAIRERLVRAHPDRTDLKVDLARITNNIGSLHRELGDSEAAIETLRRTVRLQRQALAASPSNMALQDLTAKGLANLGTAQLHAEDLAGAANSYQRSLKLFKGLAKQNPAVADFQTNYATIMGMQADLFRQQGRPEKAVPVLIEAIEIHRGIAARNAESTEAKAFIGATYGRLGQAYESQERFTEALQAFDDASAVYLQLAGDASNVHIHGALAEVLRLKAGLLWRIERKVDAVGTFRSSMNHQRIFADKSPEQSAAKNVLIELSKEVDDLLRREPTSSRARLRRILNGSEEPASDKPLGR